MATVTQQNWSLPTTVYVVSVTGLTAGSASKQSVTIACPWTPTNALVFANGALTGPFTTNNATLTATNLDLYGTAAGTSTACIAYIW